MPSPLAVPRFLRVLALCCVASFGLPAAAGLTLASPSFSAAKAGVDAPPKPQRAKKSDNAKETASKPKKRVANKAAAKRNTAKFDNGTQEADSRRIARLKRECKGQVNAGACAGYTR